MGLDLNKRDVDLVSASGASIAKLEIVFAWEDAPVKGIKARLGFKGGVDVDASAIFYVGGEPMGYVGPSHTRALAGALEHGGNVKRGQGEDAGEVITIDLAAIRTEDSDVEGIALVAACAKGDFDQVDSATARIFDVSSSERTFLGNVRVPIQGTHTGVVIGSIRKTDAGWSFSKAERVRGFARDWRQLGDLAVRELA